jgi:hypothetical protein
MPTKQTSADLRRKIKELEAQLAHVCCNAQSELPKFSTDHMMASGVIIEISALGGKRVIAPFCIRDRQSNETITALQADLKRSYELATLRKSK